MAKPPQGRGWTDCGYHAVIETDGGYFRGRPENSPGAHVEGHNTGNLGVCLIGLDKFTAKQFETLRWCLETWMAAYKIPVDKIFCHYEWDTAIKQGKTCPNIKIGTIRKWLLLKDDNLLEPYLLKQL
jgi:hypothetical protein